MLYIATNIYGADRFLLFVLFWVFFPPSYFFFFFFKDSIPPRSSPPLWHLRFGDGFKSKKPSQFLLYLLGSVLSEPGMLHHFNYFDVYIFPLCWFTCLLVVPSWFPPPFFPLLNIVSLWTELVHYVRSWVLHVKHWMRWPGGKKINTRNTMIESSRARQLLKSLGSPSAAPGRKLRFPTCRGAGVSPAAEGRWMRTRAVVGCQVLEMHRALISSSSAVSLGSGVANCKPLKLSCQNTATTAKDFN